MEKILLDAGYSKDDLGLVEKGLSHQNASKYARKYESIPEIRKFVEFAYENNLTPYSGDRACILFKKIDNEQGVRNTIIGGFNFQTNKFELAGSRLKPKNINKGLVSDQAWKNNLLQLNTFLESKHSKSERDIEFFNTNNEKVFNWVNIPIDRSDFSDIISPVLKHWFAAMNASFSPSDMATQSNIIKAPKMTISPLNQILYGPPGTGKTYSTINKALAILDPDCLDENSDNRYILKARFDELLHNNRIGFVTFHQSFSYEDFVEGIKADTEDGKVHYSIEDGIFKVICEQAASSVGDEVLLDAFDMAVQRLQERCEEAEERIVMETVRGKKFEIEFIGGSTFKVFPYSTERTDPKYVASISNVRKLYLTGSKKCIYNASYVEGLLLYLKQHLDLEEPVEEDIRPDTESQQFVLIIDEINRGNIANIFGELITLIEPSKRAGGSESLTVKLPYSKKPFSVPSNLHIIGTMNTADKSLAQVDIALRRRFEFIEMMPEYSVLEGVSDIEGINIRQLLETINQRIELLYDREHMIGHSFFLPLKETPTMANLAHIFELQILPLLEEYFFEDWERVGQVLGDHLKTNQLLCFIIEKFDSNSVMKLMGNDWEQTGIQPYQRNHQALTDPQAYIGIYDAITDA
jgi:5-methylcytosine-specific restriction protein B